MRNARGLLVFLAVLIGLRLLGLRVSIWGSLALTVVVWVILDQMARRDR